MKLLLNIRESAAALGVGRSTIYELIGAGTLSSVKIGSRRLITLAALEAYVSALPQEVRA